MAGKWCSAHPGITIKPAGNISETVLCFSARFSPGQKITYGFFKYYYSICTCCVRPLPGMVTEAGGASSRTVKSMKVANEAIDTLSSGIKTPG